MQMKDKMQQKVKG